MNCKGTLMARLIVACAFAFVFLFSGVAINSVAAAPREGTYVGQLEGTIDLIGIDVSQADSKNRRIVRAYLCDGEPNGDARWYTGVMQGNKIKLKSVDGLTTLEVKLGNDTATGSLIFADGSVRGFKASRSEGIGGIYDIELTADGVAFGVSLSGNTFFATKSAETISNLGDGRPWEVTVTTAYGGSFNFIYHDFTTFSVPELQSFWLPTSYASGPIGIQPDRYTVVWFTGDYRFGSGGGLLFGRSGDVKKGFLGTNIWPGGADPS